MKQTQHPALLLEASQLGTFLIQQFNPVQPIQNEHSWGPHHAGQRQSLSSSCRLPQSAAPPGWQWGVLLPHWAALIQDACSQPAVAFQMQILLLKRWEVSDGALSTSGLQWTAEVPPTLLVSLQGAGEGWAFYVHPSCHALSL